ncbi:MAG: hypothetical protein K0S93_1427 [Nitrososphaeraceae archaeon]|nr:hypothetical protein [Nitrososphaeraceae archaeon]
MASINYTKCNGLEPLINTILDHNEIYEIKYEDDKQKPEFIKWNHNYWKQNFK